MPIPNWVNFESAERSAATMSRGLYGADAAWAELLANAQGVLANRTDDLLNVNFDSYDFDEWSDLVAAARVLDLAATDRGLGASKNRKTSAILAVCAFGMAGTSVSSHAVIDSQRLLQMDLTPGELTAIAVNSPKLCRVLYRQLPEGTPHRRCLEGLTMFLVSGNDCHFDNAAEELRQASYEENNPWEGYLLRLCRLSMHHLRNLSVARVLGPHADNLPEGYLDKLVEDSPLLLPSQYEAIDNEVIFATDRNLLITLPTGTGKTLLGEFVLLSSLRRSPGLVCYIAPYVALGRQVAEKVSAHVPSHVRVRRLVGGYREPDQIDPVNRPEVLVATPERFDAMLRLSPDLLPQIKCVVVDEAHMIGNTRRGIMLEGILTRLRLADVRGEQMPRFVLLSAVLSNSDSLAKWMGIEPDGIIRGTWRPSAKRLLRWTEDGQLRLHAGDDPLRQEPSDVLGQTHLPWPEKGFYLERHFGDRRKQEPKALVNIAYLADYAFQQFGQPVLCVSATRRRTRQLAAELSRRFPVLEPIPVSIQRIVDFIDLEYPYLRPLNDALRKGVAYHNSSLPHAVRERIEQAVERRELKVVAATTTLAEGVDLPFRVTILADWLMFDGVKGMPMDSLLFRNIAGRCGRAGQFTEGDTIVFDNPVGESQLTAPGRRSGLQNAIFFSPQHPELPSAIGRLESQQVIPAVGSQLLAAIAENPDLEDLESQFNEFSFARQTYQSSIAAERVETAIMGILDPSEGQPMAIRESPIRLTPLGEAASRGGLSPETARRLSLCLADLSGSGNSRQDLIGICDAILKALSDVAEQGNPDVRKGVANPRSRPVVKPDDFELTLDMWLAGKSTVEIFSSLSNNKNSRRQPDLETWLEGVSDESSWTDRFADFHNFVNDVFGHFLPWILRAARYLNESGEDCEQPWSDWANFVEFGVDNELAVQLIDDGVVTDREKARALGHRVSEVLELDDPVAPELEIFWKEMVFSPSPHLMELLDKWTGERGGRFNPTEDQMIRSNDSALR